MVSTDTQTDCGGFKNKGIQSEPEIKHNMETTKVSEEQLQKCLCELCYSVTEEQSKTRLYDFVRLIGKGSLQLSELPPAGR